jgi:ribosome-associated protein
MNLDHFQPESPESPERPSKTRVKAMMLELQALGEELARSSPEQLKRMTLPEKLADAIREYQRISHHSARRRQMQYIGRLMRDEDADAISAQLLDVRGESAAEIARQHRLENLRQRLLDDEAAALACIAESYPKADITHLRQLRRAALKEIAEARPPRHFRSLFQALKALDQ